LADKPHIIAVEPWPVEPALFSIPSNCFSMLAI
jgi:hypothetical protein